jgi:signal transduction histidine kinase/DNA-binding response OmpR family regulator
VNDRADILIVDDRPDKHVVFRAILEDLGQNLIVAASGEQALKRVLQQDFAVILLDVNMPGLDGLETAALIRGRKRSAHVPIIFITADYGDEMRIAKGYSLGAVDFMVSPIVPEILRTKVKVFVDLFLLAKQAQRQAEEHLVLAEERAARAAAERANQRSAFLAEASAAMSGSLDVCATTRKLAQLPVPFLADVSALSVVDGEAPLMRTEIAWSDSARGNEVCTASLTSIDTDWWREAVTRVIATGRGESFAQRAEQSGAHSSAPMPSMRLELRHGPPIHSLVILPLVARGRTLGVFSLGLSISARKFDSDLMLVANDLASRAAVALDNALLYRRIHEQDRRKNEFLAMLSHELRNPLAPITNAIHVLQAADADARKVAWAKDVIGRQVKQLSRLVDDLLDVSRITQGKIELKVEAVDVSEVVNAAVEAARPFIDAQEHSLMVLLPRNPLSVRGDFARLTQVLANLLNNAAKYTDTKGRVSLTAAEEGAEIVFRVRDSGIGIPEDALTNIFDLFVQVEHTLDRSQGGLGIGLTLVKRLVEMQGGSVSAHSAGKGHGSEFTVRLPAAPVEQRVEAPRQEAERFPGVAPGECRVLVVDDNRDAAESTAMLLKMEGYDVRLAYDGTEALASVQALHPDAILLDIGLPGMDGHEVAERIRSDPANGATLIVAISGYGQADDRERSRQAGCDHHLVKPVDPVALSELLASVRSNRASASSDNVADNIVPLRHRKTAE